MRKIILCALCVFSFASCHESLEKRAAHEAEEFTRKNCPVRISEFIVNDSMGYDKRTRTIRYFYTVSGKADTPTINNQQAKDELVKGVREATSLRVYKEHGFNFAYTYYSSKNKGKKLIDVTITPEDYEDKDKGKK